LRNFESPRRKEKRDGGNDSYTLLAIGGIGEADDLVIDSGASAHVFGNRKLFDSLKAVPETKIRLADDRKVTCVKELCISNEIS